MKTTSVLSLLLVISFHSALAQESAETPLKTEVNVADTDATKMQGSYVGMFGENKITVRLEKVVGATVMGYSVVAGNERAFSGSFRKDGERILIDAKEPGDHPEDGAFTFAWNSTEKTLSGSWTPNDPKLAAKTFLLARREFKYDPTVGSFPESSTRKLTESEVEDKHSEELRLMRNEIYARHGYSFRLKEMRDVFDTQDWYMPVSADVQNTLTKTEWENDILIKRYEKYAKTHYDLYGR